ncbi:MAG: diaminopimelate epimerase, partial [bacterium]
MKKALTISFAKMSGSGNDFVVFDNRTKKLKGELDEFARRVCTRRLGIGADGMILIERDDECDFSMRYLNADGSEVDMCGNGGRCAALFASVKNI